MQVHQSTGSLPSFEKAVITIGTFDGVHRGHRKVIGELMREAKEVGGESVIITFHPHPRKIVNASEPLQLINTLDEKIGLLSETGIDHLVIVPFTVEFAALSAEEYIRDFLVALFHPEVIIIGYDHHFGKERKGNFALLQEKSEEYGYRLKEIPKYILDEIDVSSTKIRKAIWASQVETANRLLGYSYFFEGIVIRGDQLGRTIGYPTANLELTNIDKIHLGHGVYAVYVQVGEEQKKGMLSIGDRPTIAGSDVRIEVNIFDFDREIYGQLIKITVRNFLRPQEKYASLEELKKQLHKDKSDSLERL
jgi:riboflavin kinase/FMN adenylyltransferase